VKRSEALVPLGHDHHVALEAALRLRRATAADLDEAVGRFREFWAEHERRRHFEIEEELLLPALEGDADWDDMARRVRFEHGQIRAAAEALSTVEDARALGELLNDHVRFEERRLFEYLEERLSRARLSELGAEIRAAR
jgi:hemerythrin-like domain-containing protein